MKISTFSQRNGLKFLSVIFILVISFNSTAQVIRSYGQIYSNNLKGGHTIFGNTSMHIDSSDGTELLYRMNDYGSYSDDRTSNYGNDGANMQFVDIDGYTAAPATLIASGSNWEYSNASSEPSGWPNAVLSSGPSAAPFGFGSTDSRNTTLTDRSACYFTKTVNFNPSNHSSITLTLTLDDGAIVYVNGTEVGRINMPSGAHAYNLFASNNVEETTTSIVLGNGSPFVNGNNIIAVEVHKSAANESGSGNGDLFFDMQMSGSGSNATLNSSSADLILPAGSNTIKFARLYWGGRISSGMGGNDNVNLRTVKIRKGTSGAYATAVAPASQVDKTVTTGGSDSVYQSYIDITSFIASGGAGTYTVADITAATGSVSGGGNYAGWSIVVVYENPLSTYSAVRVYDGYLQVYSGGSITTQSITLTGLNAPSTALTAGDAYMTAVAWEGDANLAKSNDNPDGDYMKLNNIAVTNARNPVTNFWNGTITKNGVDVTTKSPNYVNQFGIDIDEMDVSTGYGILPNATDATVLFGTEADQYFPSVFAFTMKTKEPSIYIDKTVADATAPFNELGANEQLTYTLSGANVGVGSAYNVTIVDTIPNGVTYVPGTLEVVSSPGITAGIKTDNNTNDDEAYTDIFSGKRYVKFFIGTGATGSQGGELKSGESYSVRFKAVSPANINQVINVINFARVTGQGISGDQYVDDATALIGPPQGGPLPVKMSLFTVVKENGNALLKWTTVSEDRSDRYEIEQSLDGINFIKVGTVSGNGTTQLESNYQFVDILYNNAGIIYYRLKIYDKDGKASFTKIIALRSNGTIIKELTVYPNPFVNNIKVQLHADKEGVSRIRIINMSGQVVADRSVDLQSGDNIVVIKDIESLSKGMYTIEIKTQTGIVSKRITKN